MKIEQPDSSQQEIEHRRIELDAAARRVIGDYMRRGVPFVLYLRKYDVTVLHANHYVVPTGFSKSHVSAYSSRPV